MNLIPTMSCAFLFSLQSIASVHKPKNYWTILSPQWQVKSKCKERLERVSERHTYRKHQNSFACSGGHKTIVWIRNECSSHMCKPHVENYAKITQMRATFNTWLPSAAARTQGYQQLVILRYLLVIVCVRVRIHPSFRDLNCYKPFINIDSFFCICNNSNFKTAASWP